jgi:F-type H+-transporting ATPase subunit epsilon
MPETLKLEIVTPQAIVFSDDVHMVTLPAIEGEMGIYPQHERLITQVVPGELLITKDGADTILAVGEGLVEVTATHVSILTDMAIRAEHIDEAAVQEARDRAQARLREKISDEEIASVNASMVRALAQLQVKRRQRTRG